MNLKHNFFRQILIRLFRIFVNKLKNIKFDKGIMDNIQVYLMKEYSAIVESSELKQNKEHILPHVLHF